MEAKQLEATAETFKSRIEKASRVVRRICEEKDLNTRDPYDFGKVLYEIDSKYDRRRYKCPICKDSGIVAWIDPDDGMWYGRRCGRCRYWDEQKEKAKRKE